MATLAQTLTSDLIACLVDIDAANANDKLSGSVRSNIKWFCNNFSDLSKLKFKKFLDRLLDDADALGVTVTVTDVEDEAVELYMSHEPWDTPDEEKPSKFKIRVYYRGDMQIIVFALNKGKYPSVKWVKQTQAILKGKGWQKSYRGNDLKGTDFNFRLVWFKNWLKQAKIQHDRLMQEKREYIKFKKRQELKCEWSLGQIAPIAEMIEERIPGLHVTVEHNEAGDAFWLRLWNVEYSDPWGGKRHAIFMPIEAYERFKLYQGNIGWRDFTYLKLKEANPCLVPMYSLVRRCGTRVERNYYWERPTIYIGKDKGVDSDDCYVTIECDLPEGSAFQKALHIKLDKIEEYVNAWLSYEEKCYHTLMDYDAKLRIINTTIPEEFKISEVK